jgi:PAS domain S-box-containing protein
VAHFDARWHSPETLQAIFDQLSDSIFFYDKNLHLVSVNKSGAELLGLSAADMLGRPSSALFHVTASGQSNDIPGSTQSAALPTGTVTLLREDGRERLVVIRSIELLDGAGALEGVVATVTEVSDIAFDTAGINGASRARKAAGKFHPIVLRNRKVAAVAGGLFLIFIVILVASKYGANGKQPTPEEKRLVATREAMARFNAMTPSEHIEQAKLALRPGATGVAIKDGLRHLKAIPPSAPEAGRANTLEKDLAKAENLASAQSLIDASSNGDLRSGMEKLQRANVILEAVTEQYPNDSGASQLLQAAKSAAEQLAMRSPQEFAVAETKLVEFTWQKGGFGTVMMANFTIHNDSPVDVADFKITCEHYSAEGVVLDQNAGTAFGIVKAHATAKIPNINMGFLNSQSGTSRTTKTECEILSLKLASDSETVRSTR